MDIDLSKYKSKKGATNKFSSLVSEIMSEFNIPENDRETFNTLLHGAVLYSSGVGIENARYAMKEAKGKGMGYFWGIIRRIKQERRNKK